jgi:hypothetical protein
MPTGFQLKDLIPAQNRSALVYAGFAGLIDIIPKTFSVKTVR